jgi:hypothetical protein
MIFFDLEYKITDLVNEFIRDLPCVNAQEVGLDSRCGNLFVGEDFIAAYSYNDNRLQYYGGFEYISKDQRKQFGDLVIYLTDHDGDRVSECLENFKEKAEA